MRSYKGQNTFKVWKNYYQIFEKYIQICIGVLALLNSCNRHDFLNDSTEDFVEENFPDDDAREIKNTINKTEIKNLIKNSGNINKFNLKAYAYVYIKNYLFSL